jgi:DNA-binding GntR family transcriptional regulator
LSADDDAERYVRDGIPPFVDVYDQIRDVVAQSGLEPGDPLPGDVALAEQLGPLPDMSRQ